MKPFSYDIEHFSLVFLGKFNPSIFTPYWLAYNNFINKTTADSVKPFTHEDASVFDLDFCRVEVTKNKLQLSSSKDYSFVHMCDLSQSILNELIHTPIHAYGFNLGKHVRFDNEQKRDEFAYSLFQKDKFSSVFEEPAINKIVLTEKIIRDDLFQGRQSLIIEASHLYQFDGVFILLNSHFQKNEEGDKVNGCNDILESLRQNSNSFYDKASSTIETLLVKIMGQL